ncbi:MAG: signal peptidase I [Planctomycetota bacterium]
MPDTDKKPEPAEKGKKKKEKKKKNKGRELFECLLVAGALALTIRHFCFQIFKIPTRSMEPALYGNEYYGDRVVAMMWYKRGGFLPLKFGEVKRWQVIVFDHKDKNMPRSTNYIKRVVGLPDETVELHDGDVWVKKRGDESARIVRKPRALQDSLWIKLCDMSFSDPRRLPYYWEVSQGGAVLPAEKLVDGGRLLLAAEAGKPVDLRWRPGRPLDNRFLRLTVRRVSCPNPECPRGGRPFRAVFDTARPLAFCPEKDCRRPVWGVTDDGYAGELELAATTSRGASIGDFWSEQEMGRASAGGASRVGDLRLALDFEHLGGEGALELTVTARSERFALRLPLGPAEPEASISREGKRGASRRIPMVPGVHHLELVNVDGEFRAELDGVEVGPVQYTPPIEASKYLTDAEISVSGGARLALEDLRLYRDIYYGHTTTDKMLPCGPGDRSSRIYVKKGHYFFLGDNSLASKDGRMFGTKPEEKIVARGLFVAWPPSRMHLIR